MWRTDSLEKTLMLGKIEGWKRRGRQGMSFLDGKTDMLDMSLSKLQLWLWTGKSGVLQSMGLQRVGHDWAIELNWTDGTGLYKRLLSLSLSHSHIAHHSINPSLSHLSWSGGGQLSCLLSSPMNWSFLAAAMLVNMKLILLPIEMILVLTKRPPGYHFIWARTTQLTNSSWFLIHRRSQERINVCCFKLLS